MDFTPCPNEGCTNAFTVERGQFRSSLTDGPAGLDLAVETVTAGADARGYTRYHWCHPRGDRTPAQDTRHIPGGGFGVVSYVGSADLEAALSSHMLRAIDVDLYNAKVAREKAAYVPGVRSTRKSGMGEMAERPAHVEAGILHYGDLRI